jgi:hypothetical protein
MHISMHITVQQNPSAQGPSCLELSYYKLNEVKLATLTSVLLLCKSNILQQSSYSSRHYICKFCQMLNLFKPPQNYLAMRPGEELQA